MRQKPTVGLEWAIFILPLANHCNIALNKHATIMLLHPSSGFEQYELVKCLNQRLWTWIKVLYLCDVHNFPMLQLDVYQCIAI